MRKEILLSEVDQSASTAMSEKEKQKDESDVKKKNVQYELLNFTDKMLETDNFDEVFKSYPTTEDTKCGFGLVQGAWLQM